MVFEQDEQDRRRQKLCTVLDLKMIIDTIPTAPQFVEIVSFKPKVIVILEEAKVLPISGKSKEALIYLLVVNCNQR